MTKFEILISGHNESEVSAIYCEGDIVSVHSAWFLDAVSVDGFVMEVTGLVSIRVEGVSVWSHEDAGSPDNVNWYSPSDE